MRAVHISKVTGIAGSEAHLLRLLPGLASRGIDVRMVVLEAPRHPARDYAAAMVAHGVPTDIVPIYQHLDPTLIRRLTRLLREYHPDIVHTHLIHGDLYGIPAAGRAKVPCILSTRHNDDAFRRRFLLRALNRALMRRAARVITISHALARFTIEIEGTPPEKVVPIHYGLEAPALDGEARQRARARLGVDEGTPLVGAVGRLVWQKGFDVLLDAFHQVRRSLPQVRLVIVGDGPLRAPLRQQATRLGIERMVDFAGWRPNARDLMPAFDVLAVPSRWEGFGLVTLEAMGCARPIVASKVSALPEIVVHGETGLLVPAEAPDTFALALVDMLGHPGRAATMGQAGYERLRLVFSVERMVTATLERAYLYATHEGS
jgi:glycosyltransferase involved in cell wall biosynthesis